MKQIYFLIVLTFLLTGFLYSQTDIGPDTKLNVPGDWSITPAEKNAVKAPEELSPVPQELMNKYLEAKESNDEDAKIRLGSEIDKYLNATPSLPDNRIQPPTAGNTPPESDWGIGDILVHSGSVKSSNSWRAMDMKMGEDGNLYIAVNRSNVSGFAGYISVYRSSNGGRNWLFVSGATSAGLYYGQISMLVEKRHATNDDSTRIFLYFVYSSSSTMNDAVLYYVSFLRSGTAWYGGLVASPTSGNKFQYPSACSDGMYYSTATYVHCVVQEVTNANVHVKNHHFRTTTWGSTHTSGSFTSGGTWQDWYPSAAFSREVTTSSDSLYVAVERRFTSPVEYALRLLAIPEVPSANYNTYYLAYTAGKKYEKPCITIQQEYASTPRKILVTSTKDMLPGRTAVYHYSTNSGSSWAVDVALGYTWQQCDFTWCNSDSTTSGGGYFIAAYVDLNGDSVAVRRGVLGSMGTVLHKRNSYTASGVLPPVVAIYKSGTSKYSAFAYAGYGPINVYFNQESLPTVGIEPVGTNIPDKYSLSQNYPNPFNPITTINFSVPKDKFIKLSIFNILGEEVAVLVNETLNAGEYKYTFDAAKLSSGIYFYRLLSDDFTEVKKMTLIK